MNGGLRMLYLHVMPRRGAGSASKREQAQQYPSPPS